MGWGPRHAGIVVAATRCVSIEQQKEETRGPDCVRGSNQAPYFLVQTPKNLHAMLGFLANAVPVSPSRRCPVRFPCDLQPLPQLSFDLI